MASNPSLFQAEPSYFRIGPQAFTASIFTILAIAVTTASVRVYLRIRAFGRLHVDDYFMIAAVIFFAASTGLSQASRDLIYLQMSVDLGLTIPDFTFADKMLFYTKLNTAEYMLQWSCIFCVKFSYIFFFRPLTSRIRPLQIWWWVMVSIITPAALITIGISPWVCPYFDMTFLAKCILNGSIFVHERIILQISTATDIATDLLVISIPVWLLTSVKLELRRKLALGTVLCLSIFMVIIAVIRYTLCAIPLKDGSTRPDTIWLFFWQSVESCVAIIMVSFTAFRSLYGQEQAKNRYDVRNYKHVDEESAAARKGTGRKSAVSYSSGHGSKNRTLVDAEHEELQVIHVAVPVKMADVMRKAQLGGVGW